MQKFLAGSVTFPRRVGYPSPVRRWLRIPYRHGLAILRELHSEFRQLAARQKLRSIDKLHLGAGEQPIKGWANIDLGGRNIHWDLTRPIPVQPGSIRFIYSEHFIEHVGRNEGAQILRNCFAIMAPGGVIRISTPDLRVIVDTYSAGEVVQAPHGSWFPETPCQYLNEALHFWDHQFIYDEDELRSALTGAGFTDTRRMPWRQSDVPELASLETRPDLGDLIMEAIKPID